MANSYKSKFCPLWEDIVPILAQGNSINNSTIELWSLVLQSQGIPHTIPFGKNGRRVVVYSYDVEAACFQIKNFIAENVAVTTNTEKSEYDPLAAPMVVLYMFFLLCLHVLSRTLYPALKLYPEKVEALGRLDSGRLLSGEYWRAVTAVTLHGDPAHICGNMIIGGVIITVLAQRIGAGYALFPSFCCAVIANVLNAYMHGPGFYAVGFSGAIFAATGILAAYEAFYRKGKNYRQAFVAVAAGLSLLAALGTGGGNTDLAGHFFGFIFGLGLGTVMVISKILPRNKGDLADFGLYLCAFVLPLLTWGLAFYNAR